MICSKVAVNCITGEERYPRNTNRVTRTKSCASKTCSSLGEHGKIVEAVAYDFLFS